MTYVITEPCVGDKNAACVDVCPVDCIHPTADEPGYDEAPHLFIHPTECIDCNACLEACPVEAVYRAAEVPPAWMAYAEHAVSFYDL